jgi:hypothetical protein
MHFRISAPPINRRTWEAPPRANRLIDGPGRSIDDRHIVAEVKYENYAL